MQAIDILVILNIIFGFVNIGILLFSIRKIYIFYRKEILALFIGEDKEPAGFLRVPNNAKTFKHKKGRYNITEPQVSIGRKKFLFYKYGEADPIDIHGREDSRMPAEVYQSIFQAEIIKALHKINPMSNMNWKQILLIVGVGIIAFIILRGM